MFLCNQIARFVDCQYLWKESTDILDFLYGDSYFRKLPADTITLGWV